MPRQTYTVPFKDGHKVTFDGPAGMTTADLVQRARQERDFQGGEIATTKAGGSMRHLLEDEQPAVKSILNGIAAATGQPELMAAAPFISRGAKHLSQFLATGHTDAPAASDLAWDAAEGGTAGYGGQLLAKTARGVGAARAGVENFAEGLPSWQDLPKWAKGGIKLPGLPLDVATSKPVLNAVERVGNFLTPGRQLNQTLDDVVGGLRPGAARAAELSPADEIAAGRKAFETRRAVRQGIKDMSPPEPAPPTLPGATGTGAPAEAGQGVDTAPWLRRLGAEADAARPVPSGAFEATGTSAPAAAGQGADLEPWLQDMGDTATSHARGLARRAEFDAAQPRTPLNAPEWPGSAPATEGAAPEYPSWIRRAVGDAEAARPGPRSLEPTGTGSTASAPDPFPNAQAPSWGASGNEGSVETPAWLRRAVRPREPVSGVSEAMPPAPPAPTAAPARQFPGEGRYRAGTPEVEPAGTPAGKPATPDVSPTLDPEEALAEEVQRHRTSAQFEEYSPAKRAGRLAEKDAKAAWDASSQEDQEAAAAALMDTPSFRPFLKMLRGE